MSLLPLENSLEYRPYFSLFCYSTTISYILQATYDSNSNDLSVPHLACDPRCGAVACTVSRVFPSIPTAAYFIEKWLNVQIIFINITLDIFH